MPKPTRLGNAGDAGSRYFHHRFREFPVLENDRLRLRKLKAEDAGHIREISFYDGMAAASDREALEMLAKIDRDYQRGESVHWGICLVDSPQVVGTCGFYRGYPGNVGEIGYILREEYRGRGIMTDALGLILDFGKRKMKLAGFTAYTGTANGASIGVLERLGFERVRSDQGSWQFAL